MPGATSTLSFESDTDAESATRLRGMTEQVDSPDRRQRATGSNLSSKLSLTQSFPNLKSAVVSCTSNVGRFAFCHCLILSHFRKPVLIERWRSAGTEAACVHAPTSLDTCSLEMMGPSRIRTHLDAENHLDGPRRLRTRVWENHLRVPRSRLLLKKKQGRFVSPNRPPARLATSSMGFDRRLSLAILVARSAFKSGIVASLCE